MEAGLFILFYYLCIGILFIAAFLYNVLALIAPGIVWPFYAFSQRFRGIKAEALERSPHWEFKTRMQGCLGTLVFAFLFLIFFLMLSQPGSN